MTSQPYCDLIVAGISKDRIITVSDIDNISTALAVNLIWSGTGSNCVGALGTTAAISRSIVTPDDIGAAASIKSVRTASADNQIRVAATKDQVCTSTT